MAEDDSPQATRRVFGIDVPENLEPIKVVLDNSGEGGLVRFRTDDLIDETKQKLGDHAARITRESGNRPVLKVGSRDFSTRTGTGNPAPISDVDTNAEFTFTSQMAESSPEGQSAVTSFQQSSEPKFMEEVNLAKGKTDDGTKITVEDFYNDVNANLGGSIAAKTTELRQLDNNRFSETQKYLDPLNNDEEDDTGVGDALLQIGTGKHTPSRWPEAPALPGENTQVVFDVKKMKNLGLQVLMESSGEYYIPDDTDNVGQALLAKAASTAPGLARMGLKIRSTRFQAAEIAAQVDSDFQHFSNFPSINDNANLSHGSVNNPLVPFHAVSASHAKTAAILLAATIGFLLKKLAELTEPPSLTSPLAAATSIGSNLNLGQSQTDVPKRTYRERKRNRLGSFLGRDKERKTSTAGSSGIVGTITALARPSDFFNVEPTQHDYSDSVKTGLEVFFGAPSGNALQQLGGTLLSSVGLGSDYQPVSDAPGYYSVILRMLIKSVSNDILGLVGSVATVAGAGSKIENIGAPTALDVNKQVGLDADPTNILNTIAALRDSRVVKFMNVMARMGDLCLFILEKDKTTLFDSTIDSINDFDNDASVQGFPNPASLIKKDRLSARINRFHGKHAWGSNTIRSLYMLPDTFTNAEETYTGTKKASKALFTTRNFVKSSKNRLEPELVRELEMEMDSYYMPFYFHDIRTNEIINFHAFIEDLQDSFTADYTETEAYGRVGKIYTYKNTNRSINFSFKVVSTNPNDFNEMWLKINKLIMLLYPQYTQGRAITFDDSKFIQPFSQLISNSPLIRLRLGDLFKTNFSDFDLARMFGIGTEQFKVDSGNNPTNTGLSDETLDQLRKDVERIEGLDLKEGDQIILDTTPNPPLGLPTGILRVNNPGPPEDLPENMSATVLSVDGEGNGRITNTNGDEFIIFIGPPEEVGYTIQADMDSMVSEARAALPVREPKFNENEDIKEFFRADGPGANPVVKSFDSVAGEGLAGFIKSISLDFNEARWQTEGLNNKAPMWMTLTMEFAPVNDLNPGLDSSGSPVGMPYNVGALLKAVKIKRQENNRELERRTRMANKKAQAAVKKTTGKDQNDESAFGAETVFGGAF